MSRPLYLHVGVQKTGTTSLQRFLERNAAALADLVTLRTPREGTPMRPLGRAAIACSLAPSETTRAALLAALDRVLDGLPEGLPTILSHENLAGAMPGNGGETRLYPELPGMLALIFARAEARGWSPHAVIHTRRMEDWLPSVWAQAVRSDGYDRTLAEFRESLAALPGWDDLTARLERSLGAARVTRLRREEEPDPARPGWLLLARAGVPEARLAALAPLEDRAMERLGPSATEFLRRLNGLALNPHARDRVADLVARSHSLFAAPMPSKGTL